MLGRLSRLIITQTLVFMSLPHCKDGLKCYRVNTEHVETYTHDEACASSEQKKRQHFDAECNRAKKSKTGCKTSTELQDKIKKAFLVDMPDDFYKFWEFCVSLNSDQPCDALQETVGLRLVGPYDILAGKFDKADPDSVNYLLHWRYFYDPPEFLTVVGGDEKSGFHIGYFRDNPKEMPSFVASNCAQETCEIKRMGETLFAAVRAHIQTKRISTKDKRKHDQLMELEKSLVAAAQSACIASDVKKPSAIAKDRYKRVVAKTFHKAGIVVSVDEKEVGYRPLGITDGQLKTLLADIRKCSNEKSVAKEDELQELITYVQFANDECDYGMGLELGMDLFCFGTGFEDKAANLLSMAYSLLARDEFATIAEVHSKNRSRPSLSQLEV